MMRKYILLITGLVFLFITGFSSLLYANLVIEPEKKSLRIIPGRMGYINLKIYIPGKAYIYANPKGPGIGKPTTVSPGFNKYVVYESPRFLPPKKYTPPEETSYVFIYKNNTEILVPFKVREDTPTGQFTLVLSVDALLCDAKSCTPYNKKISITVSVVKNRSLADTFPVNKIHMFSVSGKVPKIDEPNSGQEKVFIEKSFKFNPVYISKRSVTNFIQAILFGLLAGFLLNFMPCVLPVVSLKILGFMKNAREDRKVLIKLGLLFVAGILFSFLVLASLAAFLGYNWGQLFQQRAFLIIMTAIVFVLALSLFDVFTLNIPAFAAKSSQETKNPFLDSFAKGLLATLLATPCSGPFLGGTLAWSLTQKPLIIFIIFMSVGLGMSLPYLILTIKPGLMSYIPKSGEFTVTLERIMGFLLLATTVYLIGILDIADIIPVLWFLFFTAIGFWQYGKYGSLIKPAKTRITSLIVLIIIITTSAWFSFSYNPFRKKPALMQESVFSIKDLEKNRSQGKISMVKFTADWCPNCFLVEKTSLYTERVMELMKKHNITLFVADITTTNKEAESLLKNLGSRSIPFLAVFPPHEKFLNPLCLRDIYSEKDVIKAIRSTLGKK